MRRRTLALLALILISPGMVLPGSGAVFLGVQVIEAEGVGGLSGIEVSDDGRELVLIGDRGLRLDGRIRRNDSGTMAGLEFDPPTWLTMRYGRPVRGEAVDAEGLACRRAAAGGACNVSFEVIHRVVFYAAPGARAQNRADPETAMVQQRNSGLEALAIDPQGRLLAIPERSGALDRPFPVLRLEDGRWTIPFSIRRAPPFLVVGADVGPDGRLYVLERHFTGFAFRSRVRSFALYEDRLDDERTHLTTLPLERDNLEGIAVWRDATGAIRLTMVSDDNFNALQRTEIVEYRLP